MFVLPPEAGGQADRGEVLQQLARAAGGVQERLGLFLAPQLKLFCPFPLVLWRLRVVKDGADVLSHSSSRKLCERGGRAKVAGWKKKTRRPMLD